ncbi:MAG: glycoside hydrolase family 10 protein [Calothrix sp. C42_A2020_038]|nr:glycoside hydrolase family 10 protein [Calothrix sp. C42_A2020_038]
MSIVKWCVNGNGKQRYFAALMVLSLAVTMFFSLPTTAQMASRLPNSELRGVWLTNIDSNVLFEKQRLNDALQRLKELNFNIVYPTVWNWGWTLYPSKVAQRVIGRNLDPEPGLQGRDMLKEVVESGHAKGLKVIPWFEFGFMAPADSQLAKRHPTWLTSRSDGTKIVKEGTHDRVWLNPFRPDVQQFMLDLIVEIVKNYDIDGIQFDDHFGLPSELGYDSYTVALYQKENRGKLPPKNPQDPEWLRWRTNKITNYMKRVFTAIKAAKKNCLVSVSPNPQRFSYDFFLADWQRWERMGLIEELVLQIYRNDLKVFNSELDRPEVKTARSHIPVSVGIISGLKNKYVPMQQIQTQVQNARERKFAGVSFFFYETLWNMSNEPIQQRQASLKSMFPTPATYPNLLQGWKGSR